MKTSNKILSAFLAFALVISSAFAAFAFSNKEVTYTAKYEGNATRGTYAGILQDANDMLAGVAFTGDTLATLWGVVPGMTSVLPAFCRFGNQSAEGRRHVRTLS